VPAGAWAAATSPPPGAPVSAAGDAAILKSRAAQTLDELQSQLAEMQSAQATTTELLNEYDRLMADEARNAAALAAKIQQIDAAIRQLTELAAKLEKMAQLIESLLPEMLAMIGSDANAASCRQIGARLLATGYIDAAQNVAIANGKYRWTVPDIRAALARGTARLAKFKRPEATSPEKKKPLTPPGSPLPAPAGAP
jgi:DNA repair exonuclease SbcCD ATPase subunit